MAAPTLLDRWLAAWQERSFLPGVWLLHGPEHSRKMHALKTIALGCDCRSFSPNLAAQDQFAHNEQAVKEAKEACATSFYGTTQVFCVVRVDLFEPLFQKALLPLLERSISGDDIGSRRAWILTARNLSHCIPPLRSRAQLVRCSALFSPKAVELRPLRESVHNLIQSRDTMDAKQIILDAFLRGALAREIIHELSLQMRPAQVERLLAACVSTKIAQDDWLAVLLVFEAARA